VRCHWRGVRGVFDSGRMQREMQKKGSEEDCLNNWRGGDGGEEGYDSFEYLKGCKIAG